MQRTFHYHQPPLFSHRSLLCNAILHTNPSLRRTATFAPQSPISRSCEIQIRDSIVCARKRKRRSGFRTSNKWVLELVSVVAANSKLFPPPVDLVISVLCGGDGPGGGGSRFWNGFGGGFDGWRRRGKKKLGLVYFVLLVGCGLGLLLFGNGPESAQLWKVWGVSAIGFLLLKNWSRWVMICILGLCSFGVLGMKKEDRQKWVERARTCSPVMEIVRARQCSGRRRRRRRSL